MFVAKLSLYFFDWLHVPNSIAISKPARIILPFNFQTFIPKHYTGCPRRNVKYFGRVFLVLNYTDITDNTYIPS